MPILNLNIANVIRKALKDLQIVAASEPNERLPKEEQIRCSLYAAIRPLFHVVCAERGYSSIDDGSRGECDLWASSPGKPEVWIEFKRCWAGRGWVNKAPEQLGGWEADIDKLRSVSRQSDRYFIMVGLFDCDPMCKLDYKTKGLTKNNLYKFQ